MRKQYLLFSFLLFILISCGKNGNALLPINSMKVIMWQMMNADNLMINNKSFQQDKNKKNLYNKIFSFNKTTEKQFYSSYKYYSLHPEQMKVLYDSIESYGNLERRQFEFKHINKATLKK